MAILEARVPRTSKANPIDIEDVRRAHELLSQRDDWRVNELFAA
jgi:hypothetical protein